MKKSYCIICNKEISKKATKCKKCYIRWLNNYHKGTNHWNWQNNKTHGTKCKCGELMSSNADRCRRCFKLSMLGKRNINYQAYKEKNNNWQGGISFLPYSSEFHSKLKESIRKRDKCRCKLCNKKQNNLKGRHKTLHVHHIDYDKTNCKKSNLISLCWKCHLKTNFNRDYWYAYFTWRIKNDC